MRPEQVVAVERDPRLRVCYPSHQRGFDSVSDTMAVEANGNNHSTFRFEEHRSSGIVRDSDEVTCLAFVSEESRNHLIDVVTTAVPREEVVELIKDGQRVRRSESPSAGRANEESIALLESLGVLLPFLYIVAIWTGRDSRIGTRERMCWCRHLGSSRGRPTQ